MTLLGGGSAECNGTRYVGSAVDILTTRVYEEKSVAFDYDVGFLG